MKENVISWQERVTNADVLRIIGGQQNIIGQFI